MSKSLAIKYRPITFDDVVEQNSTKIILQQQLESGEVKNAYLFVGSAGTGKTTCARIFANEINEHKGNPIELDAASNNSIEDVREIIQQAKTKSLDSEYKVFIIDECHALSNSAWQAMLKLIEEPPAKSIFIFCTTDPQKIPKTIISRVQRYDFKRISQQGIVDRLRYICDREVITEDGLARLEALEYIAKLADGGMRDAITLMDKCLAYSKDLTLENVVNALGTVNYDIMIKFMDYWLDAKVVELIQLVEEVHASGKDLRQFIKQSTQFMLDVCKYGMGCSTKYINLPMTEEIKKVLDSLDPSSFDLCNELLSLLINLNSSIKYSSTVKYDIEAELILSLSDNQ